MSADCSVHWIVEDDDFTARTGHSRTCFSDCDCCTSYILNYYIKLLCSTLFSTCHVLAEVRARVCKRQVSYCNYMSGSVEVQLGKREDN